MSYFAYEFLTVGVLVSLQAVEAALRYRLGTDQSFARLIERAVELDIITADDAGRLDAGRQLRNDFSHPSVRHAWTYGTTAPLIEASHAFVALAAGTNTMTRKTISKNRLDQ